MAERTWKQPCRPQRGEAVPHPGPVAGLREGSRAAPPTGDGQQEAILELQRTWGNQHVQRMLQRCGTASRPPVGDHSAELPEDFVARTRKERGAGMPLQQDARLDMEQRFGRDFGGVRVHVGRRADALSREIGAEAFAFDQHIFFSQGAYQPTTRRGKRLLAHELTHVLQQPGRWLKDPVGVTAAHDPTEREATRTAARLVDGEGAGSHPVPVLRSAAPLFRRNGSLWERPERTDRWEDARSKCRNQLYWSDGGHWIGPGREPDCFQRRARSSSATIVMHWPTDDCVEKFRQQQQQSLDRLSMAVAVLFGWKEMAASAGQQLSRILLPGGQGRERRRGPTGARTGAGIAAAWLLNRAPRLRVHRGWSLEVELELDYRESVHPWGQSRLSTRVVRTLYDQDGDVVAHVSEPTARDLTYVSEQQRDWLFDSIGAGHTSVEVECPDLSLLLGFWTSPPD